METDGWMETHCGNNTSKNLKRARDTRTADTGVALNVYADKPTYLSQAKDNSRGWTMKMSTLTETKTECECGMCGFQTNTCPPPVFIYWPNTDLRELCSKYKWIIHNIVTKSIWWKNA